MSSRVFGVDMVPVDPEEAIKIAELADEDRLVGFQQIWSGKSQYVVTPEDRKCTDEHRMFVTESDDGRKVVVVLDGKTIPVIDWYASSKSINEYIEMLFSAAEVIENKPTPKSRPANLRRWAKESQAIRAWVKVVEVARLYRDGVRETNPLRESGKPPSLSKIDFNLFKSMADFHVVGDSYYYRDVKLCSTFSTIQEIKVYTSACGKQAELARKKYLATGHSADLRYYTEKVMKSKINKSLIFVVMQLCLKKEKRQSWRLLDELAKERKKRRSSVINEWRVLTRVSYLSSKGWSPPTKLRDLLDLDVKPFDYVSHRYKSSAYGDQTTELYSLVMPSYSSRRESFVTSDFDTLPDVMAQSRQSGHYYFRSEKCGAST